MKKIDTSKSLIFGREVEDLKKSLEYLDQEGYFSDHPHDFSENVEDTLKSIAVGKYEIYPYETTYDGHYFGYFIPKSKVVFIEEEPKEKKYRPFKDIGEFSFETCCEVLGDDVITIRNKNTQKEYVLLYIGYSDEEVHLGGYVFTFADLLKNYEFSYNDEWCPFGIEE